MDSHIRKRKICATDGCGNPVTSSFPHAKFCCLAHQKKTSARRNSSGDAQAKRRLDRRRKLLALFDTKCKMCGYRKNYAALTFHHTRGEKEFSLNVNNMMAKSWDKLIKEVSKCDLLCHNCHMEVHYPHMEIGTGDGKNKENKDT